MLSSADIYEAIRKTVRQYGYSLTTESPIRVVARALALACGGTQAEEIFKGEFARRDGNARTTRRCRAALARTVVAANNTDAQLKFALVAEALSIGATLAAEHVETSLRDGSQSWTFYEVLGDADVSHLASHGYAVKAAGSRDEVWVLERSQILGSALARYDVPYEVSTAASIASRIDFDALASWCDGVPPGAKLESANRSMRRIGDAIGALLEDSPRRSTPGRRG